ncbi:MAG: transposase [Mycobacterium sp.]
MSGNRKKYTPEYREQAVRLVVDTGRPVAHVAAEIGVGEQLLAGGSQRPKHVRQPIIPRCSTMMNAKS